MAGVFTNNGRTALGSSVQTWLNGLTLRLFANNTVPAVGDTSINYTEASFMGYSAKPLTSWGGASIDANGNAEFDHPQQTFTSMGSSPVNTIYGYYLTNSSGIVVFAEADPATTKTTINASGQTYAVTPKVYLGALAAPF